MTTLRRLLSRFHKVEPEPVGIFRCCVAARAGRTDAGYYLHRVRDHGEGAA